MKKSDHLGNCSEHEHQHNHSHIHAHGHNHTHHYAQGNIKTAFLLNLFFVFVEIAGGFLTNSYAILSDAVHDLGDCAAIGCALVLEKISGKEADENYTYGYRRYSLVSALITSVILVAGSIGVVIGAAERLGEPNKINGLGMLLIAVFGVVINGIAALKTSKGKGASEKAINLHMLEDVFGWVSVLIGSVFVYAFNWYFVDTILSVVIAVFLFINASKNIKDVLAVLLEKKPEYFDTRAYKKELEKISGVENAHHIHVWSLDGENILATAHLEMASGKSTEEYSAIKKRAEKISEEKGINHLTLQMDFENGCGGNKCEL